MNTSSANSEYQIHAMPATCRHFNGIQHDACNLGIEYRKLVPANIVAWAKHIPCSVGRISAKELAPCEFLSPLSREEQEAETAELENRFKFILPIIQRLKKQHKGHDFRNVETCPLCSGDLTVGHAGYNGHTRGICATEGCLQWIE